MCTMDEDVPIHVFLLTAVDGKARSVDPNVQSAIVSKLTTREFAETIPPAWLETYTSLARGLYVHAGLRRAVYEAETLFQDGTLEGPPRPAGAPDISLMGYTGLDFSKRCTYRQHVVRKCATKDEYAMEADQEHSERVFMFDPAEIKHQLLNNPVHVKTTWDAVQVLITSELDHEDRERESAAAGAGKGESEG